MLVSQAKVIEERVEPRDETWKRVRVRDCGGARLPMLIVNLSPHGLMARSEESVGVGARLTFDLPEAGQRPAEVRWSLGGRIGVQFENVITAGVYDRTLAAMR